MVYKFDNHALAPSAVGQGNPLELLEHIFGNTMLERRDLLVFMRGVEDWSSV